jgi:hypothetical protein
VEDIGLNCGRLWPGDSGPDISISFIKLGLPEDIEGDGYPQLVGRKCNGRFSTGLDVTFSLIPGDALDANVRSSPILRNPLFSGDR